MKDIEVIISLVLLFMAVPDICARLGRPALASSIFVLFGLVLGPIASPEVRQTLIQAGEVGFLLLLFEVGLEIDLPRLREIGRPLGYAIGWAGVQYPVIMGAAVLVGFGWEEALLVAAALTGCSVGMAHAAWKQFGAAKECERVFILRVMVLLETLAVILLSVETIALKERALGVSAVLKLVATMGTIVLIGATAGSMERLFQTILERATRWRIHLVILLVFGICALGERFGLSAPKTAFFLGLFLSRIRHNGMDLEEYLAPISQRFLIPVLFVALGLRLDWRFPLTLLGLYALGVALLIIGFREVLHRRWFKLAADRRAFLLLCPNLTIAALAANALLEQGAHDTLGGWLLLTGLFTTAAAVFLLPRVDRSEAPPAARGDLDLAGDGLGRAGDAQAPAGPIGTAS